MQQTAQFRRLSIAYRIAWQHFMVSVDFWQSQEPQSVAAQQAAFVVEQTTSLYHKTRNELADYILSNRSKDPSNARTFQSPAEAFNDASASVLSGHCATFPTA